MPATAYAVRGDADRGEHAAEQEADAGHRRVRGLEQPDDAGLVVGRRRLLEPGDHRIHWIPLPVPPRTDSRQATSRVCATAIPQ